MMTCLLRDEDRAPAALYLSYCASRRACQVDLSEPPTEDAVGAGHETLLVPQGGRAQIRHRYFGGGQFGRVTDIPLLELARIGLEVKLQRQRIAAVGERLVLVVLVRGQSRGARREVECVTVPVQNDSCIVSQLAQAGRHAFPGQRDRAPADLLDRTLEDAAA